MQDQHAWFRRVVQRRPSHFDLLQLSERVAPEVFYGLLSLDLLGSKPNWRYNCLQVICSGRVNAKVR